MTDKTRPLQKIKGVRVNLYLKNHNKITKRDRVKETHKKHRQSGLLPGWAPPLPHTDFPCRTPFQFQPKTVRPHRPAILKGHFYLLPCPCRKRRVHQFAVSRLTRKRRIAQIPVKPVILNQGILPNTGMMRITGPAVIRQLANQAIFYRQPLNKAAASQKTGSSLYRRSPVTPLPQCSAPAVFEVEIRHIIAPCPLHHAR